MTEPPDAESAPANDARPPDVEVYVAAPLERVLEWLTDRFGDYERADPTRRDAMTVTRAVIRHDGAAIPVLIVGGASGKFTSICFDSQATPWSDDVACAEELAGALACEARCMISQWSPAQGDTQADDWWSVGADRQRRRIPWPNH